MAVITLTTKVCYREHKFPAGHPERACQIGLDKLDLRVCRHCTWLGSVDDKPVGSLTDGHLVRLAEFLKTLKADEDAATLASPEAAH